MNCSYSHLFLEFYDYVNLLENINHALNQIILFCCFFLVEFEHCNFLCIHRRYQERFSFISISIKSCRVFGI